MARRPHKTTDTLPRHGLPAERPVEPEQFGHHYPGQRPVSVNGKTAFLPTHLPGQRSLSQPKPGPECAMLPTRPPRRIPRLRRRLCVIKSPLQPSRSPPPLPRANETPHQLVRQQRQDAERCASEHRFWPFDYYRYWSFFFCLGLHGWVEWSRESRYIISTRPEVFPAFCLV